MREELENGLKDGIYEHFISLGYCCHVASDLEKMGLRNNAMPFDWTKTRWRVVSDALLNHFANYLVYDSLYQYKGYEYIYEGCDAGVVFPHDFVEWRSLKSQFNNVKKKYQRRIDRFYTEICKPSVLIRYCWDLEELQEVLDTYENWVGFFKRYNEKNEFIIITHNVIEVDVDLKKINLFFVEREEAKDDNSHPILNCPELFAKMNATKFANREKNIAIYEYKKSVTKKRTFREKINRKWNRFLKKYGKKYIHSKQV